MVNDVSTRFAQSIENFSSHPMICTTRSIGLIGAIELVQEKTKKIFFDPSLKVGAHLVSKAQEEGLILRVLPGEIIAFCPPLIIKKTEIDEMFLRFQKALDATASHFSI